MSENINFLDLEFNSIGSWADEVESDLGQYEDESESAGSIKFNPKYAYQAQKVKESLPASEESEEKQCHQYGSQSERSPHSPSKYRRTLNNNFNHFRHDELRQDDDRHDEHRFHNDRQEHRNNGHRRDDNNRCNDYSRGDNSRYNNDRRRDGNSGYNDRRRDDNSRYNDRRRDDNSGYNDCRRDDNSRYDDHRQDYHRPDDTRESKYTCYSSGSGSSRGRRQENFNFMQQSSSGRYDRDRGGISPLRSPLNSRSARSDRDKYSKYKRRKRGYSGNSGSSGRPRVLGDISEGHDHTKSSLPLQSQTLVTEDDDDEQATPVFSKRERSNPSRSRSRKRLSLPEDVEDSNRQAEVDDVTEDDEDRLARREKDIVYGKSTESYKKYIQLIPLEFRDEDCKVHPRTPLKNRKCSRRSWDAQIRIWKLRVHNWAGEIDDFLSSQSQESESVSNGPRWADVVSRETTANGDSTNDLHETVEENVKSNEEDDDESFLDDFELDCNVGKTNDSTKLDSDGVTEDLSNGES